MRARRRILAMVSSVAVAVGTLVAVAPHASASGQISVFGDSSSLGMISRNISMGEEEFLQILETDRTQGTYTVRIWDESVGDDGGLGRPMLLAVSGCVPLNVASAELECTFNGPPGRMFVQFRHAAGPTNLAIMDDASIALDFIGSRGNDYVQGGGANDTLLGMGGNDLLFGGGGDDLLEGGPGDDYLEGESGNDDMRGGSGSNSLDAADGQVDVVDCGGVPAVLDFDKGKDEVRNCGENPTPIPPAPIEPEDPPAPGEGDGTVDGVPTDVDVGPTGDDNKSVTISTGPQNPLFQSNLWWFGTPSSPPVPTFPPSQAFTMTISPVFPNSVFDLSIFPPPPLPPDCGAVCIAAAVEQRAGAIATESYTADANGVVRASVPIPGGLAKGDYTLQFNGITASGAQMSVNVGVRLDQATPDPQPEPEESITIDKAKRGKGKKAAVITIRGTTVGLAGTSVTPRYRVRGAKKWKIAAPVTVSDSGTFSTKITSRKQVTIQVRSGAVKSTSVKVAAAKRR